MAARNYNHWLQKFVEYGSIGEAPLSMYFWVGVSTIAGALRRQVWIDEAHYQWLTNFYVVLVAPPGIVQKSTTMNIGMNLLREIPGIHFGPDVVTWQSLVQSLAASTEAIAMPDGMFHPMSAITIASSEFGTFLNPNDREMVDVLVSLWDGQKGVFKKATKTQGSDQVENPWVNIIAATTPAWISGNFPEYMIGGGFTSRCVFVYAEEKRQYIAYPSQHLPPEFQEMKVKLIQDLEQISLMAGPYEIEPAGYAWGEEWYAEHYKNRPAHLDNERFGGYIARKQTHIHKLAMILAASQRQERAVLKEDLIQANTLITTLEDTMAKVFAQIGRTEVSKHVEELVRYVRQRGDVEYSELFRYMFRVFGGAKEFEAAVQSGVAAGMLKLFNNGATILVKAHGEQRFS